MPLPAPSPDILDFVARVAHAYAKLIASPHADPESSLGGKLFYVGEMDDEGRALVVWRVDSAHRKDFAVLDAIALECLDADDWKARRWLRLAPRYLGRFAQDLRLLSTHREFAARFSTRLREQVDRGEIAFPCEIRSYVRGLEDRHCFEPTKS